jgi:tetratricopeptide (TPR) repeat protein
VFSTSRYGRSYGFTDRGVGIVSGRLIEFPSGLLLEQQEKFDEAIAKYDKCLEQDSENITALHHKGNCLYFLGKLDEAVKTFVKVRKRQEG